MKVINEKGKLFGIINVVDLLVLVAVIAVVAGVGYKLFAPQIQTAIAPTAELTVISRTRGALPRQYEEMVAHGLPQKLVSGNSFVDAELVDITYEPYVVQVTTADGRIVDAVDPTKIDIVYTIKAETAKDAAVAKIGTQEIRAGRDHLVKTQFIEQNSIIEKVIYGE